MKLSWLVLEESFNPVRRALGQACLLISQMSSVQDVVDVFFFQRCLRNSDHWKGSYTADVMPAATLLCE